MDESKSVAVVLVGYQIIPCGTESTPIASLAVSEPPEPLYYLVFCMDYTSNCCMLGCVKRDGRKLDHGTLAEFRLLAVKRVVEGGEKPSVVMASLGLCRTSIYPWIRAYEKDGWEGLVESIAQGPEPKLSKNQRRQIKKWILGKDPRQYGLDFGLWTRRIISELIEKRMGISIGLTAVGRLLAQLDIRTVSGNPQR